MRGLTEHGWGPAADLVWTHYDDSEDWVVFHPQSGDVYLVTSSAHILWKLIADGRAPCCERLRDPALEFEKRLDILDRDQLRRDPVPR